MPKTTKRDTTKREERVAKAHATPLPPPKVKQPKPQQQGPGYKRPTRGLARYPWAIALSLLVIASSVFALAYFHVGPFAPAKPKTAAVKPRPAPNLTLLNPSPCLKVVKQLTDTSPAPTAAEFNKIQHTFKAAPPKPMRNSMMGWFSTALSQDLSFKLAIHRAMVAVVRVTNSMTKL